MINKVPSIPYPNILISNASVICSNAKAPEVILLFLEHLFDLADLFLNRSDDQFIFSFGF
jgi:hypothetical protein